MPESNMPVTSFIDDMTFARAGARDLGLRAPIFPTERAAERAGWWVRATLLGDERAVRYCATTPGLELRAAGGSTNAAGGYLVPDEIEDAIVSLRNVAGVFRRNAAVRPMGAETRTLPRRTGGLTGYYVGENSEITDSDASWGAVFLRARKAAALTRISAELVEDSAPDLAQWFVEEMAFVFADMEDSAGFNGDGTSTYGGMIGICPTLLDGAHNAGKVTAASGHDTFAEIDATDLANTMAALPEQFWPGAKFYCSGYAAAATFMRLGAVSGGTTLTAGGPRPMLSYAGVPIELTPRLPGSGSQNGKVMLLFGDLRSAATLGSRRGMEVRTSRQRHLETDQIAVRGTERFHIVCHDLGDGTTAGPMVCLIGG